VSKTEPDIIKKVDELCRAAAKRGAAHTDFLDEGSAGKARARLENLHAVYTGTGGYEGAQRTVLFVFSDSAQRDRFNPNEFIGAVLVRPADGKNYSHRDYLGSLMSLGISREKIGDVAVNGDRAYVLSFLPMTEYISVNLSRVAGTGAQCSRISLDEIEPPEPEYQDIRYTVSSLRADCVAAAVFSLSREQAARCIHSGLFSINWSEETKPDRQLKPGDMLGLRGKGRARLAECPGLTKKGRVAIVIRRER